MTAPFRRLWLAGLISDTGDWLLLVALPIVVYQRTGSTLGTAGAFLIELAPPVALAPLAGRLADRFDRRRTLVAVSLAQAATLTPLLLVPTRGGLALLYAVIAAQSALAALFDPTKNALLPTLVAPERLVSANSLIGLNQNLGRLVGGPLGGVLLALGHGLGPIVAVDVASFLAAVVLLAGLPATPTAEPAPPPPAREPRSPRRPLRAALAVMFTASVAQGIFVVLFVVFVARSLHGGAAETGLLRGVQAIGALAAALALATAAARAAPGRLTALSAVAFGLVSLATWNAPHVTTGQPLYVALFIAAGAPGVALLTGLVSAVQQATADGERGRAFAALATATSLGQATGMVAAGLLGDRLGVVTVLNGQALLYLLAGALAAASLADRPVRRAARLAPS